MVFSIASEKNANGRRCWEKDSEVIFRYNEQIALGEEQKGGRNGKENEGYLIYTV